MKSKYLILILILFFICVFMTACTDTEKDLLPDQDVFLDIENIEVSENNITTNENISKNQTNIIYSKSLSEMIYPEWINLSENFEMDYKIYSPIDHDYNIKRAEADFFDSYAWEFADIWRKELDYQYNKCIKNMPEKFMEQFIKQQSSWEDYFYSDVFPEIAVSVDENGIVTGYGYENEATLIWLDRIRTRTLEIMRVQQFLESIDTIEFYYETKEEIISEKEAVELVINLFFDENDFELSEDGNGLLKKFKNKNYYLGYIDYIHNESENYYLLQYYELVTDEVVTDENGVDTAANHSVTYNWYKVNIETREAIPMYRKNERGYMQYNENYEQTSEEEQRE